MASLPVIISVPHGGDVVAPELIDSTLLTQEDIFSDGDPLTRQLYDFRSEVAFLCETPIARATIDLNRPPTSVPPENLDGVVKSHTTFGKRIYYKNRVPKRDTLKLLLNKYYVPFHQRLWRCSRRSDVFCGLDCHTMLDRAPVISDEYGQKRPFICLSNNGDVMGEKVKGRRLTCPPELINSLALFLKKEFPAEADNILLNEPFRGGHIVKEHSKTLPWIQIELNRNAYLDQRWFDEKNLTVCQSRVQFLRDKLFSAITAFVNYNFLNKSMKNVV